MLWEKEPARAHCETECCKSIQFCHVLEQHEALATPAAVIGLDAADKGLLRDTAGLTDRL